MIDNYDSFVYNLVQYIGELDAEPVIRRHDEIDLAGIGEMRPDGILISPGPGTPDDAGISNDVILNCGSDIPVFGVCLGMQCMGQAFGGDVVRAPEIVHGKTSVINHKGVGVFEELPNPLEATRYHSLCVERSTLPAELEITAETNDEIIMGLRHKDLEIEGVQFHPESILSVSGHAMISTFLGRCSS